jgi:hypothetical protein
LHHCAPPGLSHLALRRPAYHSSSHDFNLTAQLVTDGVKETALPRWVVVRTRRDVAVLLRLVAVRGRSGDRILPALPSDNYVTLLPGERRTVRTEVAKADARGESPAIRVEGFDVR